MGERARGLIGLVAVVFLLAPGALQAKAAGSMSYFTALPASGSTELHTPAS